MPPHTDKCPWEGEHSPVPSGVRQGKGPGSTRHLEGKRGLTPGPALTPRLRVTLRSGFECPGDKLHNLHTSVPSSLSGSHNTYPTREVGRIKPVNSHKMPRQDWLRMSAPQMPTVLHISGVHIPDLSQVRVQGGPWRELVGRTQRQSR